MAKLQLIRTYYDEYTTGELYGANDAILCYTLELPWKDNKKTVSCIAEGDDYRVIKHTSPKFGDCLLVQQLKYKGAYDGMLSGGRSNILFHCGNSVRDFKDKSGYTWKKESSGCILVGRTLDKDQGLVYESRNTLNFLLKYNVDFLNELIITS
jgi:hypothetical protein